MNRTNYIDTYASEVANLKQEYKMADSSNLFDEGGSCMSLEDAGAPDFDDAVK